MCVFCRNEENETRSKQTGEEIRKLCSEASMVVTVEQEEEVLRNQHAVKSQPRSLY